MPNIIKTHTYPDGQMIGWDADQGAWVEVDREMMEGSFAGNVGRGAARGMEEIAQGSREISGYGGDERVALEGEQLQAERQAASAAAPWAENIGNVAPDVAAGLAMTPLTGAMSLPAMLGTEMLAGTIMGGLRPGSVDERIGRAAIGGALSVGGAALSVPAAAGVGAALRLFKNVEGETLGRIGREADSAAVTLREARRGPPGVTEAAVTPPAGRSAGAAETPEEMIGRTGTEAEELAELEATEAAGAESLGAGFEKKLDRAISELGHTPTIGQGTRAFSPARLGQATREYLPLGQAREASVRAANQANLVRHAAKATGDEGFESVKRLDPTWFGMQEARIGEDFKAIESRLPRIDLDTYTDALGKIEQQETIFGKMRGQRDIERAIENAKARGGGEMSSREVMETRKLLSAKSADYFSEGAKGTEDGKVIMDALNRLDDAIETEIKRNQYKKGLSEKWARAREQWGVLKKLEHGASVGGTGDVNPKSLMKQMQADRSKGGYGKGGPQQAGAVKDLFDLTEVMVDAESAVPMTGMRRAMQIGSKIGANQLGIGGGAIGAASLWD